MTAREQWIAFRTHVRKEIYRILRIWPQTLFPPLMQAGLYYLVFGTLMGNRSIEGVDYPAFMIPGLAMTGVINGAYINVCFSLYGQRFQRSIEELLASPLSIHGMIGGFLVGGVFRGLIVGLLTIAFGLALQQPSFVHHWGEFLLLCLISALPLALAGFLNALYARSFDQTSLVPTFVLMPLTFLGGTFYTLDSIAPSYRWLVEYNPFYSITCGFRHTVLGLAMPSYSLLLMQLSGLSLALYVIAWICVKRGYGLRN